MKRFLKIIKAIVFTIGILSSAMLLLALFIAIFDNFRAVPDSVETTDSLHQVTFGDSHHLAIEFDHSADKVNLKVENAGKATKVGLGSNYITVDEVRTIPAGNGTYRIVVFAEESECDYSTNLVYCLTYDGELKLVKTISMSSLFFVDENKSTFIGNVNTSAPYVEENPHWSYTVPTLVEIDKEVRISPLLTENGRRLMRDSATRARKGLVIKDPETNQEDVRREYDEAVKELEDALRPQVISF